MVAVKSMYVGIFYWKGMGLLLNIVMWCHIFRADSHFISSKLNIHVEMNNIGVNNITYIFEQYWWPWIDYFIVDCLG